MRKNVERTGGRDLYYSFSLSIALSLPPPFIRLGPPSTPPPRSNSTSFPPIPTNPSHDISSHGTSRPYSPPKLHFRPLSLPLYTTPPRNIHHGPPPTPPPRSNSTSFPPIPTKPSHDISSHVTSRPYSPPKLHFRPLSLPFYTTPPRNIDHGPPSTPPPRSNSTSFPPIPTKPSHDISSHGTSRPYSPPKLHFRPLSLPLYTTRPRNIDHGPPSTPPQRSNSTSSPPIPTKKKSTSPGHGTFRTELPLKLHFHPPRPSQYPTPTLHHPHSSSSPAKPKFCFGLLRFASSRLIYWSNMCQTHTFFHTNFKSNLSLILPDVRKGGRGRTEERIG